MLNCDSYLIDHRALELKASYKGSYKSQITTTHGIYFSEMSPRALLDAACIRSGSTKVGRIEAVKKLLKYPNKTPFLIAPFDLGVFPTMSSKHLDCVWIFNHRFEINEYEKGRSIVTFSDGTKINLETSKHILRKQQQKLHTVIDTFRTLEREREENKGK